MIRILILYAVEGFGRRETGAVLVCGTSRTASGEVVHTEVISRTCAVIKNESSKTKRAFASRLFFRKTRLNTALIKNSHSVPLRTALRQQQTHSRPLHPLTD